MYTKYKIQNTKLVCRQARYTKGYTFLELIIVMAIFAIISSVVVFNFRGFSTNISLQNTTSDIALQLKEAQSDAIAGRLNEAINTLTTQYFKPSYGIHFSTDTPSDFIKFTDLPIKDGMYANLNQNCDGSNPECLKQVKINGFDTISSLCVHQIGNPVADCSISNLDISFERPFPDAIIVADNDPSNVYNDAEIVITSSTGVNRKIIINAVGNISTEQVPD